MLTSVILLYFMVAMSDPVMPSIIQLLRLKRRELGPVLEDLKVLLTALGFSVQQVCWDLRMG